MTARATFTRWFLYPRDGDRPRSPAPSPADYDRMSDHELRAHARVSGIAGFAGLDRRRLIAALLAR